MTAAATDQPLYKIERGATPSAIEEVLNNLYMVATRKIDSLLDCSQRGKEFFLKSLEQFLFRGSRSSRARRGYSPKQSHTSLPLPEHGTSRIALAGGRIAAGISALCVAALILPPAGLAKDKPGNKHWVATWTASPTPGGTEQFNHQTLREIVHTSIGGHSVRVRISNTFGTEPLLLGGVHVALRSADSSIRPGSDRPLTFSKQSSISVAPGALVISDPVPLDIPADGDLAVSIFLPETTVAATIHPLAMQTTYVSTVGDLTGAPSIEQAKPIDFWPFLTGVDVEAPEDTAAIVALGDSITDGYGSTPNTNQRWPNLLATRMLSQHQKRQLAVVDAGISANRILHGAGRAGTNALERFDRDVLVQPGVKYVLVLEGINDIGQPGAGEPESQTVSANEIIAGLLQLIARAHERELRIYGATLTPFAGARGGYYTPEKETKREAVNQWIRSSGAFDGVIDFDKATQDPRNPTQLLPAYDVGDHLHPSDAGYRAMQQAVDLSLFQ